MEHVKQYARKNGVWAGEACSIVATGGSLTGGVSADAGYVVTLTGRRRFLPDIKCANTQKRAYAERQVLPVCTH